MIMCQSKLNSKMLQATQLGRKIEQDSFAIIDQELGSPNLPEREWVIVRRVIHASADFEFRKLCKFHPHAIDRAIEVLQHAHNQNNRTNACNIIVDVQMISVGLNAKRLAYYGAQTHCFINDEDVIANAQKQGNTTRAIVAMQKAEKLGLLANSIVAIGNAPTALIYLAKKIQQEKNPSLLPAMIIGVPVGFVSADKSKSLISAQSRVPWIITEGRKGGSPIAVAILHALFTLTEK